jgi:hypothetical protein
MKRVEMKKKRASCTLTMGLILKAYAAGIARIRTTEVEITLAINELVR